MTARSYSLERRLAWRLALLLLIATGAAVAVVALRGYSVFSSLRDRSLQQQSAYLAQRVFLGPNGVARFEPTPELLAAYAGGTLSFVIHSASGEVIAAIPAAAAEPPVTWAPPDQSPTFYEVEGEAEQPERYGIIAQHMTPAGPVWVSVVESQGSGDAFLASLIAQFLGDAFWVVIPFVGLVLFVGHQTLRRGLGSMRLLSRRASEIGPQASDKRLPANDVPEEVLPLVEAVNSAFDRMEAAYTLQREFTANAAHQLRTPLAILTARLETRDPAEGLEALRTDVARMNRLVQQLLQVARLDAQPLDVSERIDLRKVTAGAVAYMAPLAIQRGRSVAYGGSESPVWIRGNADAIGDALVNLIENAIAYTKLGSTVRVELTREGRIDVLDRGPGIAPEHRAQVVRRFWRGPASNQDGAGLGLAIVAEILRQHGAELEIGARPGGGAVITLSFRCLGEDDNLAPAGSVKSLPHAPSAPGPGVRLA